MEPHSGYVFAAYAASTILLAALVIWVLARDRKLRAELDGRQ